MAVDKGHEEAGADRASPGMQVAGALEIDVSQVVECAVLVTRPDARRARTVRPLAGGEPIDRWP